MSIGRAIERELLPSCRDIQYTREKKHSSVYVIQCDLIPKYTKISIITHQYTILNHTTTEILYAFFVNFNFQMNAHQSNLHCNSRDAVT